MDSATNGIVLIGFMGAGKSAVGRELSWRLRLPRYDTDEMIRQRFGISIPEIFVRHGETAFRDAETEVLKTLSGAVIVVTGGGIVLRQQNVDLLRRLGRMFWLDAPEHVLWDRVSRRNNRPLLQTENPQHRFKALLEERLPRYRCAADHRIDTSCLGISEVANELMGLI